MKSTKLFLMSDSFKNELLFIILLASSSIPFVKTWSSVEFIILKFILP